MKIGACRSVSLLATLQRLGNTYKVTQCDIFVNARYSGSRLKTQGLLPDVFGKVRSGLASPRYNF